MKHMQFGDRGHVTKTNVSFFWRMLDPSVAQSGGVTYVRRFKMARMVPKNILRKTTLSTLALQEAHET